MPDSELSASLELEGGIGLLSGARGPTALQQRVTEIFLVFRQPVYRYLVRTLHDPGEAEDLAQEVFLRLFSGLSRGEEIRNVRAWLFRVAHNLAIDWQRQVDLEQRRCQTGHEPSCETPTDDTWEAAVKREEERKLKAALSLLSPQECRCLELRAEGLLYREIAEVLSIRISSVETFLARAIRKIMEKHDA